MPLWQGFPGFSCENPKLSHVLCPLLTEEILPGHRTTTT